MAVTRREFLRSSAGGLAAATLPVWLAPARADGARSALLVVVFLRGGADGLDLVPPLADPDYARQRGSLALADAPRLDSGFGLHPGLAKLRPLFGRGEIAVVHAVGLPSPSRSHFEAQDWMEMGLDGDSAAQRSRQGWLTRAFGPVAAPELFSVVGLGLQLPLSLSGSRAFSVAAPQMIQLRGVSPSARRALERLYADSEEPVSVAGRQALEAERRLRALPRGGRGFGRARRAPLTRQVDTLFALESAGLSVRAATMDLQGWDTHVGQRGPGGVQRLAGLLADGLLRLLERAGEGRDVLVVVMTEFGRTARPNGSGGSDHGHGSVMLIAGPRVRGGVHGEWPGLEPSKLFEGRDLAVTTDYRDVLVEVLATQVGQPAAARALPGFGTHRLGIVT